MRKGVFRIYANSKDPDQPEKIYNLIRALAVHLGPVVQSIVSLTSTLVVKMLTVLVSIIAVSQVFLLKAKAIHIFQQKY